MMKPFLPYMEGDWTAPASLPGGDIPGADFDDFLAAKQSEYDWVPAQMMRRLARTYGTRLDKILAGATSLSDLGTDFGGGVYASEIDYVRTYEFARTAEDVLMRRTKLGLHLEKDQIGAIEALF